MPTLTINGNIRTNTAAGWAADATVYSAKTILVTTDVYWGSTDQRKFKLADGVQTWSNLDYPPFETGADTLSEVLTAGNSTGGQAITGDSMELFLIVNDAIALLGYDAGAGVTSNVSASSTHAQIDFAGATYSGFIEVQDTKTEAQHDNLIELDSPSVRLVQETASRVAILDASKDIVGADTATYPSLTELSYVKGVTSAIQTQIDSKKITTLQFQSASFSPADSTTYRITPIISSTAVSTGTATRVRVKLNNAVSAFTLYLTYNLNVAGSNEGTQLTVRNHTQSTEANFTTSLDLSVTSAPLVYTATLSCSANDEIELLLVTPVYATNPTAFLATFFLSF